MPDGITRRDMQDIRQEMQQLRKSAVLLTMELQNTTKGLKEVKQEWQTLHSKGEQLISKLAAQQPSHFSEPKAKK